MRVPTYVIVASVLLLAVVVITLWPPAMWVQTTPGQYPIGAPRFEWPATEKIAPYRPSRIMGSDAAMVAGGVDTKAMCVSVPDCTGKPQRIPVAPNYSGIITE